MSRIIVFILFEVFVLNFSSEVYAQYDNIWMLGYGNTSTIAKPSIDFSNGTADTFSFPRPMQFFLTNSSICNSIGELQFYTNGYYIENINGDTLNGSTDFNPGWLTDNGSSFGLSASQGVITIPFPADTNKFIVFHVSGEPFNYLLPSDTTQYPSVQPFHLGYTIVDMLQDGGLGGVSISNLNVHAIDDTLFLGWITACKHANGRDWWIVLHKWYSDTFYRLLITPLGIESPITQQVGPVMLPSDGLRDFDASGQAVFSPDGSKLAMSGQSNILHLYDFDRCTGLLSNHRSALIDTLDRVRGCSFSPDSRFLYVSHFYNLYQFDTFQSNLSTAGNIVAQYDSFLDPVFNLPTYFYMHQLAPDGKIYINPFGGFKYLHFIDQPNSFGVTCNFVQHQFELPSLYNLGLPNFPNYNLGSLAGSPCDTLTSINEFLNNAQLELKVFPNPVSGTTVSVEYTLEKNQLGHLEIFDINGHLILLKILPQWSSSQRLHLPFLSDGVYFVKLKSGNKATNIKLVLMRE